MDVLWEKKFRDAGCLNPAGRLIGQIGDKRQSQRHEMFDEGLDHRKWLDSRVLGPGDGSDVVISFSLNKGRPETPTRGKLAAEMAGDCSGPKMNSSIVLQTFTSRWHGENARLRVVREDRPPTHV